MAGDGMLMDLYRCVEQPQRWPGLLDSLCDRTGAHSAVLQLFELRGDAVHIVWQASDTRTTAIHLRNSGRLASAGNPRIDRQRILRCANRVVCDDDLFPRHDAAREALQQQLAEAGLGAFLGYLLAQEDGHCIGIALHRAAGTGADFDPDTPVCLTALAPHVGQASRLGRRLNATRHRAQQLQAHLDLLRCAALVCDGEATLRWMNRSAEQLVQAGGALGLHAGRLRAGSPAHTARLRQEIAAAACSADGAPRWLALAHGGRQLHLALQCQPSDDGPPAVLLIVTDTGGRVDAAVPTWCRLLGVTPAEGLLVAALVQGRTLDEHAAQRGVSLGTVRNQLKQVLAKTGSARQADLVRLALGSAAAQVHPAAVAPRPLPDADACTGPAFG